ncbi:AAA domain-containing protein [Bifidobacterium saguinibicoloris]|uniref:AAA domain-containing protein n=1 Tax=Bifidobacterium saguinibicoloris TaxID=2834433 RepID=UPI001C578F7F|nr:AAA domain-containing protein [Bifidobacterium saguinibicoloris]MBW3081663.1 ATP-binding protein [Bifidobacterium saguinibicoloris]
MADIDVGDTCDGPLPRLVAGTPTARGLIDYLIDAACVLGFGPKPGRKAEDLEPPTGIRDPNWQSSYSLAWYFTDYLEQDLAKALGHRPGGTATAAGGSTDDPLVAFLGMGRLDDAPAVGTYRADARREDAILDSRFPQDTNGLNRKQREALHKALHNKVSIIKGPPGTGKTEVIMHIIALAVERGETVAVVSSNNSAVRNVVDKATEAYRAYMRRAGAPVAGVGPDETDLAAVTATMLAALGSTQVRRAWRPIGAETDEPVFGKPEPRVEKDGDGHVTARYFPKSGKPYIAGAETKITFDDFTRKYPIVTSTIHSLKKCFADGAERKYDLLIIDEASQTNVIQGIVALSCARRVVIVGDEEQLPPVVNDAYAGTLTELAEHHRVCRPAGEGDADAITSPYDLTDPESSFLTACYRVFDPVFVRRKAELESRTATDGTAGNARTAVADIDTDVTTTLTEHYRCPAAIIEFCNQYVYRGVLKPAKPRREGDPAFPLALRWYDGDYREGSWLGSAGGKDGKDGKGSGGGRRSSSVNDKQLTVFRMEELPYLKRRLKEGADAGRPLSVCLLTPFRGQQEWLERLLRRELQGIVDGKDIATERLDGTKDNDGDGDAPAGGGSPTRDGTERAQALTIHKSQGQGFDIVYLLPVEDGNWEWPWSQGRHLINVAVSRAKRELRVIASTTLMSRELQRRLTGGEVPANAPADERSHDRRNQQMFIRKLADYIAANAPVDAAGRNLEPDFGVIRSRVRSIFDIRPAVQERDRAVVRSLERRDRQRSTQYAPENIVLAAAARIAEHNRLVLLHTVKWPDVLLPDGTALADVDEGFHHFKDPSNTEFDVVLARLDGRIVMAIEADGVYHRFARETSPQEITPFERRQQDMRRLVHRLAAGGTDVVGASAAASGDDARRTYPPREDVIERDLLKDRIVMSHAHGTVVHLGADSSSSGGDRRPYLEDVRLRILGRRPHSTADEDGDPDHAETDSFRDDVFTPGAMTGVDGLVLLRVPSDGSTYLETDALRRAAGMPDVADTVAPRPTIEDYVRACDAALDDDGHFALRVRTERVHAWLSDDDLEAIVATRRMLERYESGR